MDDALNKFETYFRAGIKSCWLISPIMTAINIYTNMEQAQTFQVGDIVEPVLNIRIPITAIFE